MREMTGTEVINRRASDILCHYDNPKLVKSRSNLELTAHSRQHHHHRSDKGHDKHGHTSHRSHDKSTSRKNSRSGQRGSDAHPKTTRSKTKDSLTVNDTAADVRKNSASGSILPPISGHQISNPHLKNGGHSPRAVDASGPTRMAVRNSNSPENVTGKAHDNYQSHSSLERSSHPQTPPITAGPSLVRNASTTNVIGFSRAAHVTSPESPRALESSRLSPINTHDRAKVKFEKKIMKLMVDDSVPSSPRAYKISSAEIGNQQQQPPPSRDSQVKQRRPSVKSLPKIAPTDEPFSVRRKIEQFRKWHEEHYADALKNSPKENEVPETAQTYRDENVSGTKAAADDIDFKKILEDNIVQKRLSTADGGDNHTETVDRADINGNIVKAKNSSSRATRGNKSNFRPKSSATWKTWRDINQSDAYDDVQKYIKDNELMDDDRAKWIKTWICDVRKAMEESDEMFVDE